jgi:Peptidase family S64
MDVVHPLKLDPGRSGREVTGYEGYFDVELDKSSEFPSGEQGIEYDEVPKMAELEGLGGERGSRDGRQASQLVDKSDTGDTDADTIRVADPPELDAPLSVKSGTQKHILPKTETFSDETVERVSELDDAEVRQIIDSLEAYSSQLHELVKNYPLIDSDSESGKLPYSVASTSRVFNSWNIGRQKAVEWHRGRLIQTDLFAMVPSEPAHPAITVKAIVIWCRQNQYGPPMDSEPLQYCRYCGMIQDLPPRKGQKRPNPSWGVDAYCRCSQDASENLTLMKTASTVQDMINWNRIQAGRNLSTQGSHSLSPKQLRALLSRTNVNLLRWVCGRIQDLKLTRWTAGAAGSADRQNGQNGSFTFSFTNLSVTTMKLNVDPPADEDKTLKGWLKFRAEFFRICEDVYGWGVTLLPTSDGVLTVVVDGLLQEDIKVQIRRAAEIENLPLIFTKDVICVNNGPISTGAITLYKRLRNSLVNLLEEEQILEYGFCLHSSNKGPVVVFDGTIPQKTKDAVGVLLGNELLAFYTSDPDLSFGVADAKAKETEFLTGVLGGPQEVIQPGVSIGRATGSWGYGTFGCLLTNGAIDVGLTAYHVVCTKNEMREAEIGTSIKQAKGREMAHPAPVDYHLWSRSQESESNFLKKTVEITVGKMRKTARQKLKEFENQRKKPKELRGIGAVALAFTGLGNKPSDDNDPEEWPMRLDYAIIEMKTGIKATNALPLAGHLFPQINEVRPTGRLADMQLGMVVFKVGRSTGVTKGVVHMIKKTVREKEKWGPTSEWLVQGIGVDQQSFAEVGDSGSTVWNESGDLVGMMWASNSKPPGRACVTPIREILDSLYEVTGSKYSLKPINLEEDEDRLIHKLRRETICLGLEKGQFDGPPIIHTDADADADTEFGAEMAVRPPLIALTGKQGKTSLGGRQKTPLHTLDAAELPSSGQSKFSQDPSSATEPTAVGAVLSHALQSFLTRLVQLASQQSSAEEQEDNDEVVIVGTTSKSDSNSTLAPLVITPVQILRAIRAGAEFDFLTNAGMATGSSQGGGAS